MIYRNEGNGQARLISALARQSWKAATAENNRNALDQGDIRGDVRYNLGTDGRVLIAPGRADVKCAVAWGQQRSPKVTSDFIEELHRAADTIREAPEHWKIRKNGTRRFLLWRFPFASVYSEQESIVTIWPSPTAAGDQSIGQGGSRDTGCAGRIP